MSTAVPAGSLYTAHFGLTEAPFSIAPDPGYLYMSARHQEALAHLVFGIGEGGGFVQLTGEVGTGKTTLCRYLVKQLPPHVDVALILNPRLTPGELLAAVCDELRIPYDPARPSQKALVDSLYRHLLDAHARGRRTVLVIDEAQSLEMEVLEQIRLLTNLETEKEKLLQIILIGQPELIEVLDRPELRQLAQRITARYHLQPLSLRETVGYIRHRIKVAGQKDGIFTAGAMRDVYRLSGGVPRLINVICDRALLGAYAREETRVGRELIRRAATEVLGRRTTFLRRRGVVAAIAVAIAVAVIGGMAAWIGLGGTAGWGLGRPPAPAAPAAARAPTSRQGGGPAMSDPGAEATAGAAQAGGRAAGGRPAAGDGAPPVAAALPAAASAPAPRGATADAPPGRALVDLVRSGALATDRRVAFAALFERWGVPHDPAADQGCEHAARHGLRCLFRSGTWYTLRRFDLPAILELLLPSGAKHYGALVRLDRDTATLAFGRQEQVVPLAEVERMWDGQFVLLWRPPPLATIPLAPGMRGRDVEWLRGRLAEVDGRPVAGEDASVYDDQLRQRVLAFQRSRALIPDGIVGEETLTHLSAGSRAAGTPRLLGGES